VLSPVKVFLCNKLPCLGWRSADILQGFVAKNVCWSSANILVLVLRFLWSRRVLLLREILFTLLVASKTGIPENNQPFLKGQRLDIWKGFFVKFFNVNIKKSMNNRRPQNKIFKKN
jgi:hypothetical protein